MYAVTGLGITVGFHRLLHPQVVQAQPRASRSRSASPARWPSRARSSAGSPTTASTTSSPTARATRTRRGATATRVPALMKGLFYAHMGWLFDTEQTSQRQYAPDLLKDRDIVRISRALPVVRARLAGRCPLSLGGLLTMSWQGARDRVLLGLARPGRPAAPRHLVDQLDLPRRRRASVQVARQVRQRLVARDPVVRRVLAQPAPQRPDLRPPRRAARPGRHLGPHHLGVEKLGWVSAVRWPVKERLDAKRVQPSELTRSSRREDRDQRERHQGPSARQRAADDQRRAARAAHRDRPRRCSPSAASRAPRSRRSPPAPRSPSRSSTSTSAARRASTPSSSTARSASCWR